MRASDKCCSIDSVLPLSFERLTDISKFKFLKFKFLSVVSPALPAWPRLFLAPALLYEPPFFKKAQDHLHPEAVAPRILTALCAPATEYTSSFILCLLRALSTSSCPASLRFKATISFPDSFLLFVVANLFRFVFVVVWLIFFSGGHKGGSDGISLRWSPTAQAGLQLLM